MQKFKSVENLVNQLKPDKPVYKKIRPSMNKSVINAYIAVTNIKLQDRPNTWKKRGSLPIFIPSFESKNIFAR